MTNTTQDNTAALVEFAQRDHDQERGEPGGCRTFSVEVRIAGSLSVEELWPAGDAPENPDVNDVQAVLNSWDPLSVADLFGFDIVELDVFA